MIRVAVPKMPRLTDLTPYLLRIEQSDIYSNNGPLKMELEEVLADMFNLSPDKIAVCSNGTLGLTGLIKTSGIHPEHKIVIPSWTFAATPISVTQAGFTPIFADVNLSTWSMKEEYLYSGSIYVSPFGYPVCLPEIESGLNHENQTLIIDAAASLPNYKYFNLTSKNRFAIMLSLHATKLIGAGEGGIVISNDVEWIKAFKKWTNFGFAGSRESVVEGSNAKMSEYSAAVALASIKIYHKNYEAFRNLTNKCHLGTTKLNFNTHPAMSMGYVSPYWIVKLNQSEQKSRLISELSKLEIEWRDWWSSGCHSMKTFLNIEKLGDLDNTKTLSELTIGLPFHHKLEEDDLNLIFHALENIRL